MKSLWKVWTGCGVLAALAYVTIIDGTGSRVWWFTALALLSIGVTLTGLSRTRRSEPTWSAHSLVAAGLGFFIVGDLAYAWLDSAHQSAVPFPSIADAAYVLSYPLLAVGLFGSAYRRGNPRHRHAIGAAAVVGVGASTLMWVGFVDQSLGFTHASASAAVMSIVYPAMAVMVLMAASYIAQAATEVQPRQLLLMLVGLAFVTGDVIYNISLTRGSFEVAGSQDFFWLLSFVLVAAASLQPHAPLARISPTSSASNPRMSVSTS